MAAQTQAEKETQLANVNAAINSILTGGAVQSYTINGRRIDKIPLSELTALRDKLASEISAGAGHTRSYARFQKAK